jgi:hypothetical protein
MFDAISSEINNGNETEFPQVYAKKKITSQDQSRQGGGGYGDGHKSRIKQVANMGVERSSRC